MARPIVLQDNFAGGIRRDFPRDQMPPGTLWDARDVLIETRGGSGSSIRKRGGWQNGSDALGAGTYAAAVGFAEFVAGAKWVVINDAGTLYSVVPGSQPVTSVGAANVPAASPTFYRQNVYIPDLNGTASLKVYNGTTVAVAGGSPPTAALSTVYKDHLVLARTSANPNRVWFSNGGDPGTWDTGVSGQWLDCTHPVYGLASLRDLILVFQEGHIERIRGNIIPGVAGSDFIREPFANVGCFDPASIAEINDTVFFANQAGVYQTDGITLVDVTREGGLSSFWMSEVGTINASFTMAGGILAGRYYIVSVMNGSTFVASFMFDIARRVGTRLNNVKATMMASAPLGYFGSGGVGNVQTPGELMVARRDSARIAQFGGILSAKDYSGAENDADGTAVIALIETPYYKGRPGSKRIKSIYLGYELAAITATAPEVTTKYHLNAGGSTFTSAFASGSFLETGEAAFTSFARRRANLGRVAEGVMLQLQNSIAAKDFRLYSIEADLHGWEQSKTVAAITT